MLCFKTGFIFVFFFGGKVENYTEYLIVFLLCFACIRIWDYVVGWGVATLAIKSSINDCLFILAKNIQSLHEINQLKYIALELSGKGEKFVDFQKKIDQNETKSLKNTIIRNYINSIPPKYNYLVPFNDWEGAMGYIDAEIQKRTKEQK